MTANSRLIRARMSRSGLAAGAIFAMAVSLGNHRCDHVCVRQPEFTAEDPYYTGFEASASWFSNSCTGDADCLVSGCNGEICAAERLLSSCVVLTETPTGSCGCVDGECVWWVAQCSDSEGSAEPIYSTGDAPAGTLEIDDAEYDEVLLDDGLRRDNLHDANVQVGDQTAQAGALRRD